MITRQEIKVFLIQICLSMVDEIHKTPKVPSLDAPHVDKGVRMLDANENISEEVAWWLQNNLVSFNSMIILADHGDIPKLLQLSKLPARKTFFW